MMWIGDKFAIDYFKKTYPEPGKRIEMEILQRVQQEAGMFHTLSYLLNEVEESPPIKAEPARKILRLLLRDLAPEVLAVADAVIKATEFVPSDAEPLDDGNLTRIRERLDKLEESFKYLSVMSVTVEAEAKEKRKA